MGMRQVQVIYETQHRRGVLIIDPFHSESIRIYPSPECCNHSSSEPSYIW